MGLGYIGLPTASILATNGFDVIGVDKNPNIIEILRQGSIHIEEPGLNSGKLKPKLEPEDADVFIIAVPTPITADKKADLSFMAAATEEILSYLKKDNLVILESTSPPGTTVDFLVPILERSKLKMGEEIFVAHIPERVLPGKILKELIENDRIIGGVNEESALLAKGLYENFVGGEIYLTDATTAELVKLLENTYRDVNIALVNELATVCPDLGVDVWEVVNLANLHPRVNLHHPGPGVGGHCISVDPWFLVEKVPGNAKLARLARQINDLMPDYVVEIITEALKGIKDPKITVLGASYKGNIGDTRESPAIQVIRRLTESGHEVSIYDPHVRDFEFELVSLEKAFEMSDCVVILADHQEFKYLNPSELGRLMRTKTIIDTRKCVNLKQWAQSGFTTRLLGKA
jgi:UDP-N-acetyl-D-mannosaminuronic acid dehydrogenase